MTGLDLRWRLERLRERALVFVVWHLPRTVVYWCAIRLFTYKLDGAPSDEIVAALKRWEATRADHKHHGSRLLPRDASGQFADDDWPGKDSIAAAPDVLDANRR